MNQRLVETWARFLPNVSLRNFGWKEGVPHRKWCDRLTGTAWSSAKYMPTAVVGLRSRELADLRLVVKTWQLSLALEHPPVTAVNGVPS